MKKLSKILLIPVAIIAIMAIVRCDKDDVTSQEPQQYHLTIDNILEEFPKDLYENSSRIVFKNETGGTRVLSILPEHALQNKSYGGRDYTVDALNYRLVEENDDSYIIQVTVRAQYRYEFADINSNHIEYNFNPIESIDVTIAGLTSPGIDNINFVRISRIGTEVLTIDNFSEELALNGKEFNGVYYSWVFPSSTAFSSIYYNPEFGVIGFQDENDVLYVFDSIE